MTAPTPPTADLLRLDDPTRGSLVAVQRWVRGRITGLKRRRKGLPRQSFSEAEMEAFSALLALESATCRLLGYENGVTSRT